MRKLVFRATLTLFVSALSSLTPALSHGNDDSVPTESATYVPRVPRVQAVLPEWGIQMTYSGSAMGGKDIQSSQAGNPMRSLTFEAEYQPKSVQKYGILGIGPSFGLYPVTKSGSLAPNHDVVKTVVSLWEVGAQLRYQARYFRQQILVPVVAYEFQHLAYHFTNGPSGSINATGPTFGLMLLLNVLEPGAAGEFFVGDGIARSYLVAELKDLQGNNEDVSISGASFFFGLRLEF